MTEKHYNEEDEEFTKKDAVYMGVALFAVMLGVPWVFGILNIALGN